MSKKIDLLLYKSNVTEAMVSAVWTFHDIFMYVIARSE